MKKNHDQSLIIPRRPFLLGLALAALVASCRPAPSPEAPSSTSVEDALKRAAALSVEDRDAEAARLLSDLARSLAVKDQGPVRCAIARSYHQLGAYRSALKEARLARDAGFATPEVRYLEGDSLRRLESFEEAERVLVELLALAPGHPLGSLSLASLRLRGSDPAAALPLLDAYFRAASPSDREYAPALLEHGRALRASGRHQEAADRFTEVLEIDPFESAAFAELAASLYRLKRREAAQLVEKIYRTVSQNAFEEYVEEGLRRTGVTALALGQKAENLVDQKRFLAALREHRRAMAMAPEEPRIRILHAELCLRLRRLRDALGPVEEGLRLGLRPASGLNAMQTRVLIELGKPGEAVKAAREGLAALSREGDLGGPQRGQADVQALRLSGARAAVEAEDRTAAESFIEPLARLFPSSWEPDYWRGRAALSKGEAPSALFHFAESARKGGSAFPDLGYWNAVALEKSGRAEESARQLEAFLASKPNHLAALEALARLPIAPEKRAQIEGRLPAMRAAQAAVESRIREADAQPLEQAGATTLEAAKLLYAARDPSAFDYYFLGADLVPRDGEAPRRILAGMTSPQDLFVRLHWLRRLLRIDPADPGALGGTATVYLRLGVKLQEAESLAEKLHAAAPSAASYRLRGEIALAQGEQEKARGIFREGLQRFPEDAQLRAAQGKFEATAAPGGDSR